MCRGLSNNVFRLPLCLSSWHRWRCSVFGGWICGSAQDLLHLNSTHKVKSAISAVRCGTHALKKRIFCSFPFVRLRELVIFSRFCKAVSSYFFELRINRWFLREREFKDWKIGISFEGKISEISDAVLETENRKKWGVLVGGGKSSSGLRVRKKCEATAIKAN